MNTYYVIVYIIIIILILIYIYNLFYIYSQIYIKSCIFYFILFLKYNYDSLYCFTLWIMIFIRFILNKTLNVNMYSFSTQFYFTLFNFSAIVSGSYSEWVYRVTEYEQQNFQQLWSCWKHHGLGGVVFVHMLPVSSRCQSDRCEVMINTTASQNYNCKSPCLPLHSLGQTSVSLYHCFGFCI